MDRSIKILAFFLVCASLLAASGCGFLKSTANRLTRFRDDDREVTFHVPALGSPECSKALLDVLTRVEGVKEAQPDLAARQVTIRFYSRNLAIKNIEHAIAKAGFEVDDTQGNAAARAQLPEPCR